MNLAESHRQIVNLPYKIGAVITGGGASAITRLLEMGGMSKVLDQFIIPYSESAVNDFVNGSHIEKSCSKATSLILAASMLQRLDRMGSDVPLEQRLVLASTASLAKENQRPDRINEAWICLARDKDVRIAHASFNNTLSRKEQEELLVETLIDILAGAGEGTCKVEVFSKCEIEEFIEYYLPCGYYGDGTNTIVFSGAFNPIHIGHIESLKRTIRQYPQKKIIIEITGLNADKGVISPEELSERICKIKKAIKDAKLEDITDLRLDLDIKVSLSPRFVDKVKFYGPTTFLMGSDTLARIVDPKYYKDFDSTIAELSKCNFEIGWRTPIIPLDISVFPIEILRKCTFFYNAYSDVSSTRIRNGELNV